VRFSSLRVFAASREDEKELDAREDAKPRSGRLAEQRLGGSGICGRRIKKPADALLHRRAYF
jgi:hypothetical protein